MTRLIRDPRDVLEEKRTYVSSVVDADIHSDGVVVDSDAKSHLFYGHLPEESHGDADRLFDWFCAFRDWEGMALGANEFRLSGIKNAHKTFGFTPPVPLRQRYGASVTRFTLKFPGVMMLLEHLAGVCARMFEEQMPDSYEEHMDAVSVLDPAWLMGGGLVPFTSGIINRTAALPYHKDAANLKGSMSAMLVLRSTEKGGRLHVPALDLLLPCEHRSVSIFDGCQHLHGVTPLSREGGAERYSIVFYAKREFAKVEKPGDEVRRAQIRATQAAEEAAARG